LEWIEGERLEIIAPHLTGDTLGDLGWSIGSTLAGIHNVSFEQQGFFDASLAVDVSDEMVFFTGSRNACTRDLVVIGWARI
jgi:hypothetical protein